MKRFGYAAILLALTGLPSLHAEKTSQDGAVDALRKLGWVVSIDEKKSGKPTAVIRPGFGKKVTEEGIVHLKNLPRLETVDWTSPRMVDTQLRV